MLHRGHILCFFYYALLNREPCGTLGKWTKLLFALQEYAYCINIKLANVLDISLSCSSLISTPSLSFAWFYRAVVKFVHVAVAFDCVPSSVWYSPEQHDRKMSYFDFFFLLLCLDKRCNENILLYFPIFIFIMADNKYVLCVILRILCKLQSKYKP